MQQLSRKDSHFSHFKTRNDGHFVAACGQISLQQYGVVIWEKQAGGKFVEIDCFEVSPPPILIDWAHSTFGEIICTASESGIVNLFIRTSRTSKDKQRFCLIRQFSAPFSLNISSLSFGPHTFGFFVGCISQAKQFEDGLLPEEYIPVKGHFSVFFRNPSADKSSFSDTSPLSIDEELLLPRSISINEQSWNTLHLPLRYYPLSFCWEKALPPSIYTLSEKSQSSLTSYTTSAPQAAIGCKGGDVLIIQYLLKESSFIIAHIIKPFSFINSQVLQSSPTSQKQSSLIQTQQISPFYDITHVDYAPPMSMQNEQFIIASSHDSENAVIFKTFHVKQNFNANSMENDHQNDKLIQNSKQNSNHQQHGSTLYDQSLNSSQQLFVQPLLQSSSSSQSSLQSSEQINFPDSDDKMLFPMRSEFVSQVGKKLSVGIHSAKFSPFANAVAVRFLDKTFSIWEVDPQNMQTAEHEEEGENMQKDESAEKAGVLFKFVCQIQS